MSTARFILYLLKHGDFTVRTENFDDYHQDILAPLSHLKKKQSRSLYRSVRKKLLQNKYTGAWIGNLAYVKQSKKDRQQYFFVDSINLCYVRIFKSASTSVLREILPLMDASIAKETLTDLQIDILANSYRSSSIHNNQHHYQYFTLVRNPFHRLVSVYLDLFHPASGFFSYQSYLFGILKRDMSFTDFVRVLSTIPERLLSLHFVPQHTIIKNAPAVVKFFRIEKDGDELTAFLQANAISIHHQNKNESHYSYQEFYTAETLNLAYERYQDDVTEFNYHEEYESLLTYVNRPV